jgi:ribulose-5-phosphate 4-epimerase/fuculose-1-phosphate aldolase
MTTNEGVIKYVLDYAPSPAWPGDELCELNAWRKILFMTQLIGQDALRYGGAGYGNVSMRLPPYDKTEQPFFVISGTQTGMLTDLMAEHYALVRECWPAENRVVAAGPIKPSSESLTHSMIYRLDESVRYVLHAHSPDIWRYAQALNIPLTRQSVPYGTPEMAEEVRRLFEETPVREQRIFAMGGHEDGVVTFSASAEDAGNVMLDALARAFALE